MKRYHDEAVVLRKKSYGEADLILSLFTKEGGRIEAIAKGAKRSKKRFGSVLEIGSHLDIFYEERPGRELCFLTEAVGKSTVVFWRKSWKTITVVSYVLEVVSRLLPPQQPAVLRFRLLQRFLKNLSEEEALLHLIFFEFQWLSLSGWKPNLKHCGVCIKDLNQEKEWQLSLERGEILCSQCRTGSQSLVSKEILQILKLVGSASEPLFSDNTVSKFVAVQKLFSQHWVCLIGKPLKSSDLLEKALLS